MTMYYLFGNNFQNRIEFIESSIYDYLPIRTHALLCESQKSFQMSTIDMELVKQMCSDMERALFTTKWEFPYKYS